MSLKRKTLDEWKQLIEEQQKSGLFIVAFCRENKLPISNFYKYCGLNWRTYSHLPQLKPIV
ncbi:IS66 family insertion sequence element accessory protein TnpA [Alteromonas confluentis]|uniref:IS66 family insertion sequence element accessory protein TnpA n=1 Tax=Alteromonas confluentis TaxID=1656094 RepID=UPI003CCC06C8